MKDMATKERFIELRIKGLSYNAIANEIQVSKQTLISWSKEFEIQISNLKAMELEVLQEKYYISKVKRIELLGKYLDRLMSEIDSRGEDLSSVQTEKLFELLLKYTARLKEEERATCFTEIENMDTFIENMRINQQVTWQG